jgi:predicted ATPase
MKLTYFSIENYRSITKAAFRDLSNVTILVGPNNEGKSNILQALHTCLTLLSNEQFLVQRIRREGSAAENVGIRYDRESYDWESDYPINKQAKNPEGHSAFELHFSLTDEEQKAFFDFTARPAKRCLANQVAAWRKSLCFVQGSQTGYRRERTFKKGSLNKPVCRFGYRLRLHSRYQNGRHFDGAY